MADNANAADYEDVWGAVGTAIAVTVGITDVGPSRGGSLSTLEAFNPMIGTSRSLAREYARDAGRLEFSGGGSPAREGFLPAGGLAGKAPKQVTPGTRRLEGQYVNDRGVIQPWVAHYDDYGRLIARTDYNAGNQAAGIPPTHYTTFEYDATYPLGRRTANHVPGEFDR